MTFTERQKLREQAMRELDHGNFAEYEKLMQQARMANHPESEKDGQPDEIVYRSKIKRIIERRKQVDFFQSKGLTINETAEKLNIKPNIVVKDRVIIKEAREAIKA